MLVTTEKELESGREQVIPVHRHGFESLVFHLVVRDGPIGFTMLERFIIIANCDLSSRGDDVVVAAMDLSRNKNSSSGSSKKPWRKSFGG